MSDFAAKPQRFDLSRLLVEAEENLAISTLDVNGFILTWNAGACRLKGYAADEMIGQHFSRCYSPEDIHGRKPEDALLRATTDGRAEDEGWQLRKDGSRFWAHIVITALRDEVGALQGFGEISHDLTEHRRLHEDLRQTSHQLLVEMRERTFIQNELQHMRADLAARVEDRTRQLSRTITELENANRVKDDFLATVSHELLTPLTSINGWVQMLKEGGLSDLQTSRALDVIHQNVLSQKELIQDLLNVCRIVSGKLTINPDFVNPAPILQQIIESVQPSIDAKQLRMEAELDPDVGPIRVDPVRFQQIIWNLLTNAVKFTPSGGLIRVQLKRGESQAIISISDTGEGIPPEFLPYVFDRFRQSDLSRSPRSGLGLGLSIVRHLVEVHGGAVSVHSLGRGQGSTFSVQLPMPSGSTTPFKKVRSSNSANESGRLRLLENHS